MATDIDFLDPSTELRVWRGTVGATMRRSHSHPGLEINYLDKGGFTCLIGGRRVQLEKGRAVAFWSGTPHANVHVSERSSGIWIDVPHLTFMKWSISEDIRSRFLQGQPLMFPELELNAIFFERWLEDYESGLEARHRALLLEIEGLIHRYSIASDAYALEAEADNGSVDHIAIACAIIAKSFDQPISADSVAEELGLHPKYFLRLFKAVVGDTFWSYLTRTRIAHAKRLLISTRKSALSIALEVGYQSNSAFYRQFEKECEMSPIAFRKRYSS